MMVISRKCVFKCYLLRHILTIFSLFSPQEEDEGDDDGTSLPRGTPKFTVKNNSEKKYTLDTTYYMTCPLLLCTFP